MGGRIAQVVNQAKTNNYNNPFFAYSHQPACDYITNACKLSGAPLTHLPSLLKICANKDC